MRYWWVSQNQTFRHEVQGGYLWSPQSVERRNPYWDFMLEVEPGDLILSFNDTRIAAIGIAESVAYESPKPDFGAAGRQWDDIGWRVDVRFTELPTGERIRPREHMALLSSLLPDRYSPLRRDGNGNQIYLTELPAALAKALLSLLGPTGQTVAAEGRRFDRRQADSVVEERLTHLIDEQPLDATERQALTLARRGQGRFRSDLMFRDPRCLVTGVEDDRLLVASHIRPWARCHTHRERLDPANGVLLTPTYDRLFDRGFITFDESGSIEVSPQLTRTTIERLRFDPLTKVRRFEPESAGYLAYHQEHVFLAS